MKLKKKPRHKYYLLSTATETHFLLNYIKTNKKYKYFPMWKMAKISGFVYYKIIQKSYKWEYR